MIKQVNVDIELKATFNLGKVFLYLVLFLHLMTCILWLTLTVTAPDQFHLDEEQNLFLDQNGYQHLNNTDGDPLRREDL